jgi:hypothetical protein
MILEMHCHTAVHSACSHVSAADLVQHNFDIDLQGTILTDHHYLWPQEEIEELRRKLKVPNHYLILSGQEVTTPELGDVLVYGADVSVGKGTSLENIQRRFPDAAIIWAHPYRDAQFRNQFYDTTQVFNKVSENIFLQKYLNEAKQLSGDFLRQVEVFRARTSLSIGYYLIKLNMGESENLWRVLVEAEHHLARLLV